MTIKGSSWKKIIVLMGKNNINKFMALSNSYITNINRALKNIKLDIMTDYT